MSKKGISFNRGNNPKYIYNQNISTSVQKHENNTKWIKFLISLISTFPTVTQNPWNSYMINRLISSVGLLRRPFIRLSALDCPICSFCPQRAANSTNSITPMSACSTVDPAPLRAASYPHHDGCGAERVPSRDAVGDEAWTPRPLVSFQCRKPCVTLRRTGSSMRASHVAAYERANWPRGPTLKNCDWVLYIKRGKGSVVFSLNDAAPSKSIDLFGSVQFRFTETAFKKLCERNTWY